MADAGFALLGDFALALTALLAASYKMGEKRERSNEHWIGIKGLNLPASLGALQM